MAERNIPVLAVKLALIGGLSITLTRCVTVCTADGSECVQGVGQIFVFCGDGTVARGSSRAQAAAKCGLPPHQRMRKMASEIDMTWSSTGQPVVITSAPSTLTFIAKSGTGSVLDVRNYGTSVVGNSVSYANPAVIDAWAEGLFASDPGVSFEISGADVLFSAPGTVDGEVVTITSAIRDGGTPVEAASFSYVYHGSSDPDPGNELMR